MTKNRTIQAVSDLVLDDKNSNKGKQRGLGALERSMRELGAGRSVVTDKHGKVIAGNKTAETAVAIGLEDVIVVESDGTKLVVVRRTDLDLDGDSKARKLAVADNRVGELNLEWDPNALNDLLRDRPEVFEGLWDDDELEMIRKEAASLDDLESQVGEAADDEMWPLIKIKVHPDVYRRYVSVMAQLPAETDAEKFGLLVACAGGAEGQ